MKKMMAKFLVMIMVACVVLSGCQSNSTTKGTSFVSASAENLFEKEGYGDLVINVIRVDGGTEFGDLAFGLNVGKAFPDEDGVDYTIDSTMNDEELNRLMYAFEFVYFEQLENYGLDNDDIMSLYHATQLAIWTIEEGWSTDDVVKAEDTKANDDYNVLADKIYNLYVDMVNYAVNTSNKSFKSGTVLVDVTNDAIVADNTAFDVKDAPKYRANDGTIYYRSSLFSLISDQEAGLIWDGDYSYRYKVELEGAPEGARVVNANGNPQAEFSTKPGVGSDFYIEVPTTLEDGGSFTVNATTTTFHRLEPVYWSSSEYQSLIQTVARSDSGTATFTVEY